MSTGRRTQTDLRRRRVLAYQNICGPDATTATDRRSVEKLRQARRPAAIYGASVRRRLRGRWFSLVPVRRRAMAAASAAILGTALLLCAAHWLAITWQPLAYRDALARPLRLDRPDSFGTWARVALLAMATGTSLLIYQLRRYRNDDYRGSYRIWPPVIILIGVASLDSVCSLVPWCGELIDAVMGKRVAMAGSDWLRIVLTVGGAALGLRLLAEVRHSKLSLVMMLLAIVCFAIPLAARWGVLSADTPVKWWLVTSAPLLAAATLSVSCGAYLRKLFREVRGLGEADRLSQRIEQWRSRIFPRKATADAGTSQSETAKPAAAKPRPQRSVTAAREMAGRAGGKESDGAADDAKPRKKWFAWLSFRSKRSRAAAASSDQGAPEKDAAVGVKKPAAQAASAAVDARSSAAEKSGESDLPQQPAAKAKRRGLLSRLGGWLRREKSAKKSKVRAKASGTGAAEDGAADEDNGEVGDDPSIDWGSMSKAERRRLRRELKRGGEAA